MIQVFYTDVGGELLVDMKGHGELENMEHLDVMCAATTTLANTLALNVMTVHELGMLEGDPTVYIGDDGEGVARIACKPRPEYYGIVKIIFKTVEVGLTYLATMYPDKIEVNVEVKGSTEGSHTAKADSIQPKG